MFVKVVLVSNFDDAFCRQLEIDDSSHSSTSSEQCITKCISETIAHLGFTRESTSTNLGELSQIKLNEMQRTEAKKGMLPVVTNICGKITHPAQASVYTPEVRPYIKEVRNCFGTKYRVFSTACNFDTYVHQSSTLFRGCGRKHDIQHVIDHVFGESVDTITVHQIVSSSRLGHPVMAENNYLPSKLKSELQCQVTRVASADEVMFLHSFVLDDFSARFLQEHAMSSLSQVQDLSVRMNLCRTGVLNLFVSVPEGGGLLWEDEPQETLLMFCRCIHNVVWKAT